MAFLRALAKGLPIAVAKALLFVLMCPVTIIGLVAYLGHDDRLLTWVQRRF